MAVKVEGEARKTMNWEGRNRKANRHEDMSINLCRNLVAGCFPIG
jgi:hypothetical protein